MKNKPLVSIITPSFNSEKFLEETINAVLNQTYDNIEYILVDGLSTDGSQNIIEKYYNNFNKVIIERDSGMYDAINKGLKIAKGDILCYINSDDVYPPNTIEKVVNYFLSHPDSDIVYGNLEYINEEGRHLKYYNYPKFNFKYFISLWFSSIPQPSTFWTKKVHERIGYFDDKLKMCGDFDFFIRVGQQFSIHHTNEIIVKHRRHNLALTSSAPNINKLEFKKIQSKYLNIAKFSKLSKLFYLIKGFYHFKTNR